MNIKRIFAFLLAFVIVIGGTVFSLADDNIPDGFSSLEEYLEYLLNGNESTAKKPALHDMTLAGTNGRFNMFFYEDGTDVFLEEKSTGKVYGTAIDDSYTDTSSLNESAYSNLLTVSYSEDGKTVSEAELLNSSSNDFSVSSEIADDKIKMDIDFLSGKLIFSLEISLLKNGVSVKIPQNSIKEKDGFKLVSIKLCPFFGATKPGEEGYIFYPDGSGALMNIANAKKEQPDFYSYSVYCDDKASFSSLEEIKYQDLKSFMLPCFGIKQTVGGIFAEIEKGDENAKIYISSDAFYQCCFELNYRIPSVVKYEFSSKSSGEIDTVTNQMMKGDRIVNYYILEKDANTYSDMAVLYRNILVNRKLLKKSDTPLKLSVEFFMGIKKNGIFGDTIQKLTTYKDAQKIIDDLKKSDVGGIDTLMKGWCSGGYTTVPTSEVGESAFGTQSQLDAFSKSVKQNNGSPYLACEVLTGDSKTGKFNAKKSALRDGIDIVITDEESVKYFLNPTKTLKDFADKFGKAQKNSSICYVDMGKLLLSSLGKTNNTSRAAIIKCESDVLSKNSDVAVTGGGKYTFTYANRLYDIPETDSGYYQCDKSVPFYQMVVHGYKTYSGTAANMSYDFDYQKLKTIETGSLPHFIITQNSPNLLQGTSYDEIYSSKYTDWKSYMVATVKDMRERLGNVWNETIDRHEQLTDTLVKVTYGNGCQVYLNYAEKEAAYDGITVPAKDYTVVKGK